jgi:hypothetical protein
MRAAALLLSFAMALATPAGAQQEPAAKRAAAPGSFEALSKSSSITLRGPAALDDSAAKAVPPPAPLTALQPLLQPLAGPFGGDPGRCRLTCASSYYFCLSSDAPEDCSPAWSQCRAGCDAPSPVQVISNIPVG